MRVLRLMRLLPLMLISASCGKDQGQTISSLPTPPASKTTPTSRVISCAALWVVHNRTGPADGHHDQIVGATLGEIEHNNGVIISGCGKT